MLDETQAQAQRLSFLGAEILKAEVALLDHLTLKLAEIDGVLVIIGTDGTRVAFFA